MTMEDYRINKENGLEFGLYSLGDHMPNALTGKCVSAKERIDQIVAEAKLAEEAGLDFFSVGESHQKYFVGQAHAVILGAVAQATKSRLVHLQQLFQHLILLEFMKILRH